MVVAADGTGKRRGRRGGGGLGRKGEGKGEKGEGRRGDVGDEDALEWFGTVFSVTGLD